MFGEIDERKPYSVLTVTTPVRIHALRHARVPRGSYKLQGDIRPKFRGTRERRLIATNILSIEYFEGDPEAVKVSAQTQLPEKVEVAPECLQEAEAVESPVAVPDETGQLITPPPITPDYTPSEAPSTTTPVALTDKVASDEVRVPPPPEMTTITDAEVVPVEGALKGPNKGKDAFEAPPKKRRGRPKGSKNKPRAEGKAKVAKKKGRKKAAKAKPKEDKAETPTAETASTPLASRRRSRSRSSI